MGDAVAELKDPYYTHCAICDKPWGAGELHALHRVTFHGRFIINLYTCLDCHRKIEAEAAELQDKALANSAKHFKPEDQ